MRYTVRQDLKKFQMTALLLQGFIKLGHIKYWQQSGRREEVC
jgi:hypothetical protein